MGTKRSRKGGELPTRSSGVSSLSYAATERPPPTKVPRTAAATAQPSSARRFGFKGPSISQLPTPVTAATTIKTQRSLASDTHGETLVGVRSAVDVVESAAPIELDVHVLDTFKESFSQEMTTTLEQLLAFKHKTNKFAVKARKEEQINYIKQLKAGVRDVVATIQDFSKECTTMDDKLTAEKATLERRLAVLQHAARSKDQSETELKQLRQQYEIMQKSAARIRASEQEVVRSNAVLRDNAAKLEIQLEVAQKAKEQLKLDLKAHEARMVDESRRFEDIKHELELSYERKGHNEDKRKQAELEKLQEQLSKTREELASVHKDLDNYKDRAIDAANSLNDERERRTRAEMEKCTLEAKNQALETRVSSAENEVAELKGKLQHKDGEVSNLVKSLTEIQKFNATASTKVEADKKELADKVERLQTAIRTLERQESSNLTTVRDLRNQLELEIKSRKEAEKSEQEVRARMKQLESELQEKMQKVGVEGGVRQMLEDQVRELRTEHIAVNAQMEAVKAEMKRLQFAGVDSKEQHNKQIDILEERFRQERANFRSQIDNLQEEKVSLESEVQTLRTRASTVRDGDVEELCKVKREADILRRRLTELTNQGAQSIAQKDDMILELEEKVKQGDKMRRAMHNTIQELRGNVRVFARTRPFLPSDHCDPNTTTPVISCDFNGESLKLRRPGKNPSDPDTFAFTFDKVFAPSAGQDSVFERVSEFVQSSLDGYHVCLFSYGQTGSGKTHTMQGSGNGQMRGIIPRAIEMILQECETLKDQGWNYITKVSFLEIYNETLKDLLATKHSGDNKLGIKKDSKGGVYVPGLTLVDVTATDQVEVLMERASRARSVACTDMNAQSSRSHSVFTLHLQGVNDKDGVMLNGQLNLVDLAGSERASRSNVSGDRLKETQAINKSLSCLADVFNAIGNKASHIPFRNSKLTYLLQSSLSGDGKTLMMVNLSPTLESASESLCSLRFAKQVNQCELGKPKRQIKSRKERP
ncbi:Kinesin-2 [Phytophthora cactorum]|uniref:Kinesin-like protein n=1 Tax=Phytophthora cactorum TaxID=29920 RepID=A0A329S1K0_9STRA|nr:Kinesin-like protein [Phytophthora cactorum]RAW30827.1 Kinesin-2 [Phytophthora cactorum]